LERLSVLTHNTPKGWISLQLLGGSSHIVGANLFAKAQHAVAMKTTLLLPANSPNSTENYFRAFQKQKEINSVFIKGTAGRRRTTYNA
ncbi:hypothetical protein Q1J52_05180, partial [Pseudomonas lijiangensis]|uniref:hypothetical protein n=1 Tax=Pseudomonas lijiangensis TaxID=2995658 RepID=UPI0034D547B6